MRKTLIFSIAFIISCSSRTDTSPSLVGVNDWTYYLQDISVDSILQSGFDVVVMDYSRDGTQEGEFSSVEIGRVRESGIIHLAYVSIGEAEDYRFYWDTSWYSKPPSWMGPENPEWPGNYAVRYWEDGWKDIVFSYLDRVIAQGFAGVYLDKVDEFEFWSDSLGEGDAAIRMLQFIREISLYARQEAGDSFLIVLQNGEGLLAWDDGSLLRTISGWAVEDLFYMGTSPADSEWVEERLRYLESVVSSGLTVLVVDYVDDGSGHGGENLERIEDFTRRAMDRDLIPYAAMSDRELNEINIIEGIQPR